MDKIFTFWNSLQSRERLALKILLIITVLASTSLFFTKVIGSISTNKNILINKKNEFSYVLLKAERIQTFVSSQQLALSAKNTSEFLIEESVNFDLINFRLEQQDIQNTINFSSSSVTNVSKFLNKVSSHPSLKIQSISIVPVANEFEVKVILNLV